MSQEAAFVYRFQCLVAVASLALERETSTGSTLRKRYACMLCNSRPSSRPRLLSHYRMAHCITLLFHCKKCDLYFPHIRALRYHMNHLHEGRVYCPACYMAFNSPSVLRDHVALACAAEHGICHECLGCTGRGHRCEVAGAQVFIDVEVCATGPR